MNKSIKTEIDINSSPEEVWRILTDFKDYPKWNPFIISIEGELIPGTRLINTMRNGEKTFRFKPTVLRVVPYQYFDWEGHLFLNGIFDGHHYFEIEVLNEQQVKLNHGEYFSGILSRFILKKIANSTRENFIQMNMAIKQLAECSPLKCNRHHK